MSYILMEESLFHSLMGRILNHCKGRKLPAFGNRLLDERQGHFI
ncbi:MAG: hypothetical protein Q8N05_14520 [Bacteroidota bacterium]|nr:hypothetical protein [Bacteroidota bacterium]